MTTPFMSEESGPIAEVREGMKVIDSAGEAVGKVTLVKMGAPEVATSQGQTRQEEGGRIVAGIAETVGGQEPQLPPALAERLLRTGFVKVDSKGVLSRDVYVAAGEIDRVQDDTIYLAHGKDELPTRA